MRKFSLLLPTRGRVALVARLCDSIRRTAGDLRELEVVLGIDEDDEESQEMAESDVALVKVIRRRASMGRMTRECYRASSGRYLFLVNDDAVFGTKEWDLQIEGALAEFPDGAVLGYVNDRYYREKICTFPVLPRTAAELMEGICPESYRRHCIDAHIFDIFTRLAALGHQRLRYLPHVVLEHLHFELACAGYGGTAERVRDFDDQAVYHALAEERQRLALKLARHIANE